MKMLLIGLTILVLTAMAHGVEPGGPIFLKLPEGQHVKVHFVSTGCFHHIQFDFDFQRCPALTAEVITTENVWDEVKKGPVKRVTKGTVTLTEEEAAGLDRLVEFYRAKSPGGCTTVDEISITHLQDKKEVTESFKDETCSTEEKVELTTFWDVVYRLTSKTPRVKHPRMDPQIEAQQNLKMAADLKGYEAVSQRFKIRNVSKGWVNLFPQCLYVDVSDLQHPQMLDAAWWYNFLKDDRPSFTWEDFQKGYADADQAMAAHPWLMAWKKRAAGRWLGVELAGAGKAIAVTDQSLKDFLMPVWRHAHMKGTPRYHLRALQRDSHAGLQLVFSREDPRALIIYASPAEIPHEDLDKLDLCWHFKSKRNDHYSDYAIVENDGTVHVEKFVASEEGH